MKPVPASGRPPDICEHACVAGDGPEVILYSEAENVDESWQTIFESLEAEITGRN